MAERPLTDLCVDCRLSRVRIGQAARSASFARDVSSTTKLERALKEIDMQKARIARCCGTTS